MPATADPDRRDCPASFRLDGETFRCALPDVHNYLDASDHECRVYWTNELADRRHRPHLSAT
jgi:hypothetical protein